jgi:hypothetical protein
MYHDRDWVMLPVTLTVIALVWLIISFITMDFGWPVHTVVGRIVAVVLTISIINAALKS